MENINKSIKIQEIDLEYHINIGMIYQMRGIFPKGNGSSNSKVGISLACAYKLLDYFERKECYEICKEIKKYISENS